MYNIVFLHATIPKVRNENIKRNAQKCAGLYTHTYTKTLGINNSFVWGYCSGMLRFETRHFVMTVCITFVKLSRRKI